MADGVGEHFLLGFRGTALPAWLRDFEREFGLGGVILFDRDLHRPGAVRNVESPEQVSALCREVHALGSRPLVCVDQEGGRVRRLKPERGFQELPSAAAWARLPEAEAREIARRSFAELAALGIDLDLAPVVDLDTNPDNPNIGAIERAFSADPAVVRRCVHQLAEVARPLGLRLCLKHYPGLGGAVTDSHLHETDLTGTLAPEQIGLFTELCGVIPGAAILLSHGFLRDRDPEHPACVSRVLVGELRAALPEALLITDDLQMQGLQKRHSTAEAGILALSAGADLLCIGNNLLDEESACVEAVRAVQRAVAADPDLDARLVASRRRIAQRKAPLA